MKVSSELDRIEGLVIPGGESTTMSLLIDTFKMREPLIEFGESHPVMGTCAGLILMAKCVPDERVKPLGFLDITVDRNAYGRQIESMTENVTYYFKQGTKVDLATTLIRAPKINSLGDSIHILGELDGSPVAVLSKHFLGLSFHPELDKIDIFHQILFDGDSPYYYKQLNQINAA